MNQHLVMIETASICPTILPFWYRIPYCPSPTFRVETVNGRDSKINGRVIFSLQGRFVSTHFISYVIMNNLEPCTGKNHQSHSVSTRRNSLSRK